MPERPSFHQFESDEEMLRFFQERSDDIEKVSIPTGPIMVTGPQRERIAMRPGMIIHMINDRKLIGPDEAELILNDGILTRMKIKIELMRDPK